MTICRKGRKDRALEISNTGGGVGPDLVSDRLLIVTALLTRAIVLV